MGNYTKSVKEEILSVCWDCNFHDLTSFYCVNIVVWTRLLARSHFGIGFIIFINLTLIFRDKIRNYCPSFATRSQRSLKKINCNRSYVVRVCIRREGCGCWWRDIEDGFKEKWTQTHERALIRK